MGVSSLPEIEAEFIARAHRMVWCDMATVGTDGRARTRIVHPVWEGDTAWMTSLRVGPKAYALIATSLVGKNVIRFRMAEGETAPVALVTFAAN